jgi:hypothetical protein
MTINYNCKTIIIQATGVKLLLATIVIYDRKMFIPLVPGVDKLRRSYVFPTKSSF